MADKSKPGSSALPGMDQGSEKTCSLFSLSNAHCNGFQTRKFLKGQKIDFDQKSVQTALLTLTTKTVWEASVLTY